MWTVQLERAILRAAVFGTLNGTAKYLSTSLFSGPRQKLYDTLLAHHTSYGAWPEYSVVPDIVRDDAESLAEYRQVLLVRKDTELLAADKLLPIMRQRALEIASIDLAGLSESGDFTDSNVRDCVDRALSVGKTVTEYSYAAGIAARHSSNVTAKYTAPTGIAGLDTILAGGLRAGSLGLIMGPTKRGKSHVAVAFGVASLVTKRPVLHLTLELSPEETACRYDRSILRKDKWEMLQCLAEAEGLLRKQVDPAQLVLKHGYRFSLGTAGVREYIKRQLDIWGTTCTVIVDYGSLLKPSGEDARHAQIGRIHEELSGIAQELQVPIWTPYQTNRQALKQEKEEHAIGLDNAGDSYESVQHADLILGLQQSPDDWVANRMRIIVLGARDSGTGEVTVSPDWSRTRLNECAKETSHRSEARPSKTAVPHKPLKA